MATKEQIVSHVQDLAAGNPGAARVLGELGAHVDKHANHFEDPLDLFETLDKMNLKGPALWVAYKDWAHHEKHDEQVRRGEGSNEEILDMLLEHIANNSNELITFLNQSAGVRRTITKH